MSKALLQVYLKTRTEMMVTIFRGQAVCFFEMRFMGWSRDVVVQTK